MKYANASKNVQKLLKVILNWWLWLWDVCEYDNECLASQDTNYITTGALIPALCVLQYNEIEEQC